MPMMTNNTSTQRAAAYPAHLGWRILAMTYDAIPMIPLLLICSAIFLLLRGGRPIEPNSFIDYLEFISLWVLNWAVIGSYAIASWRRGGQTMGMRPWRLIVVNQDGKSAGVKALCLRYAIVSLSVGLALLWCLFDAQKRGLHDIASGTLLVRRQPNAAVEKETRSSPSA
jgi:uncharacterized RDD family membrane protein YckC